MTQQYLPKHFDAVEVAGNLRLHGYAYFPIEEVEDHLSLVRSGWSSFVKRWEGREELLAITRPGEGEVDLGLRKRVKGEGDARDTKFYFHHGNGVRTRLNELNSEVTNADWNFIESLDAAQQRINDLVILVTKDLDQHFDGPISSKVMEAMSPQAHPYSHACLRALYYPAIAGQTGAVDHVDRCLLTAHCGDVGGDLWGMVNGNPVKLSPPCGYAVLFWGLRVLWISGGSIRPLKHWSTTEPGKDRQAFVNFVPVDLFGYKVTDNEQALIDFDSKYQGWIEKKQYHWCGPLHMALLARGIK